MYKEVNVDFAHYTAVSTSMIDFLAVFEASSPIVVAFQVCFAFAS